MSTALLEGGSGPPLLLLHGGIECGGAYWAPIIPELARSHRLVVPDVPGLGESDSVARLDPETFTAWFDPLLDLAFDQPPVVVGHSLLGNYCARFAIERGERLRQLVICSAPGIGPYRLPLGLRLVGLRYALRPTPRNAQRFESFALRDRRRTRSRNPEWFDAFSAYCLERGRVSSVKKTMRQLLKTGTKRVADADLALIASSVGLIWGRGDRMTPLTVVEGTARDLGWPLRVVDDAAHVPHIEQRDRFLGALGGLLSG